MRGRIALIRGGSGMVVGLTNLVDVVGPLDSEEFRAARNKHCIPATEDHLGERYRYAWVFANTTSLAKPIRYVHTPGAVIWVVLTEEVSQLVENEGSR